MKTEFDEALGAVPPSAVDVEAVIRRGRRTVHARQTWAAVGAGVVVVVLFAVLVPLRGGAPAPVPAEGPGESRPSGVVHGVPSVSPSFHPGAVPAGIKTYLDAVVVDRIKAYAADANYVDLAPFDHPVTSYEETSATDHTYEAVAVLKDPAGVSLLRFQIFDVYPFPFSCVAETACSIVTTPEGRQVYVHDGLVAVSKPDGSTFEIENSTDLSQKPMSASKLGLGWHPAKFGHPRDKPLLSTDELTQLALDPRLSFHPPGK